MKRSAALIAALSLFLLTVLTGCGNAPAGNSPAGSDPAVSAPAKGSAIDVDLTKLSSTMVYSEVYAMMSKPAEYIGKTVKMKGAFSVYEDPNTKKVYYACIIADATACCSQGLEFILDEQRTYPDDYPALGTDITVTGTFDTYQEGEYNYCQLIHAEMTV